MAAAEDEKKDVTPVADGPLLVESPFHTNKSSLVNTVLDIDSPIFSGQFLLRIRGLPSSNTKYFETFSTRQSDFLFQITFKKPDITFKDVFFGHWLDKPFGSGGGSYFFSTIASILVPFYKVINPNLIFNSGTDKDAATTGVTPYWGASMVLSADTLRVCHKDDFNKGSNPNLDRMNKEALGNEEKCDLISSDLKNKDNVERRKYLTHHLDTFKFDQNHVYTISFTSCRFDLANFAFQFGYLGTYHLENYVPSPISVVLYYVGDKDKIAADAANEAGDASDASDAQDEVEKESEQKSSEAGADKTENAVNAVNAANADNAVVAKKEKDLNKLRKDDVLICCQYVFKHDKLMAKLNESK